MQMGITVAGLFVLSFPPLRSFVLLGTAPMGTLSTAVRDSSDLLDVDAHHLTRSSRSYDLRLTVGRRFGVLERSCNPSPGLAPLVLMVWFRNFQLFLSFGSMNRRRFKAEDSQDSRYGSPDDDDAVVAQFERDA